MRHASAVLMAAALGLLAGCTESPNSPLTTKAQFDALPGAEVSQITGSLQTFGTYNTFMAATGATLRIDPNNFCPWYQTGWFWGNPYQMNGLKVDYYPYDRWYLGVAVGYRTSLLPGCEFTFNGPDDFVIETEDLISDVGIWIVDNTLPSISGTGYAGVDTRWLVRLYDASGAQVGSLEVDPPVNKVYFLGITSPTLFKRAVFTEINPDGGGENDYWGNIYATPRNVAPTLALADATLLAGESYHGTLTITDPDSHSWKVEVVFAEGDAVTLDASTHSVIVDHVYAAAGDYTITANVTDDRLGFGTVSAQVHVLTPAQGAEVLEQTITQALTDGAVAAQDAKPLLESVASALEALNNGNAPAALGKLGAFDNKVNALANSRRIDAATKKLLLDYSARLQQTIKKK